ncbi:hypothetical protein C8R44DRAFT_808493 [Mycena epipterygia]|nr:hypothetical protein C8R44DRAFT_808493 [Mycena epipterygia]
MPSLATRINWAFEIAEGIAHLHSQAVVWADGHFANILLTEKSYIVLADFDCSVVKPEPLHWFKTHPSPVFACPSGYWGSPPTHFDIFGFGVMLFALLTDRFPPTLHRAWTNRFKFSTIMATVGDAELNKVFGPMLAKCFNLNAEYLTGNELLSQMKIASKIWFDTHPSSSPAGRAP